MEAALWSRIPAVHWLQASGSAPGLPGCLTRVGLSGYTAAGQHSTGPGDKWRGGQGKKMQTGHSAHTLNTQQKKIPLLDSAARAGVTGGALARQLRGIPKGSRQESPRGTPKGKPEVTELLDIPVAPHSCFFFQAGKGSVSS